MEGPSLVTTSPSIKTNTKYLNASLPVEHFQMTGASFANWILLSENEATYVKIKEHHNDIVADFMILVHSREYISMIQICSSLDILLWWK